MFAKVLGKTNLRAKLRGEESRHTRDNLLRQPCLRSFRCFLQPAAPTFRRKDSSLVTSGICLGWNNPGEDPVEKNAEGMSRKARDMLLSEIRNLSDYAGMH